MSHDYAAFLDAKVHSGKQHGFDPGFVPDWLYDFQRLLIQWSVRKGRAAIFADCGFGKGPMQLVWAHNVYKKTGKPVIIFTPLAVAAQTEREGQKFGIECKHSRAGEIEAPIVITNYQRLHYYDPSKFAGAVCDESSILKNFDGAIKAAVTDFMRKLPYRLLCTATAAPNDYIELGTSSEALGELGFMDMLGRFFKKAQATSTRSDEFRSGVYRFRGHAERDFWRWVCSWARAMRKPSDLGCDDGPFILPPLTTSEHVVTAKQRRDGWLFDTPAISLHEQREERRRTITERCEKVAELIGTKRTSVAWCHLNDEGNLLEKLIPGAVEVEGNDSEEFKEEALDAFSRGQIRVLVTKGIVAGFGMNWQNCAHQTFFPSHSYEQMYQCIRRSWRFGQKNPVHIDFVSSEGEAGVVANVNRKAIAADKMFANLAALMNAELVITRKDYGQKTKMPDWL